jgi:hypothetical protein
MRNYAMLNSFPPRIFLLIFPQVSLPPHPWFLLLSSRRMTDFLPQADSPFVCKLRTPFLRKPVRISLQPARTASLGVHR